MTIKIFIGFLLFFLFLTNLEGQNDNLEFQLINAQHDSTKARLLNKIAWDIKFSDPVKSIEYAERALLIAYKNGYVDALSNGYKAKAHGYVNQQRFYESMVLYDSAIHYAKLSNNLNLLAICYNKKAGAMGDFGDFDDAILLYSLGIEAALKTDDNKLKSALCNNLADAYQNVNRNTDLVQKYFLLAIDYAMKNNDFGGASLSSANLAKEYSLQKQLDKARSELSRAQNLINNYLKRDYLYGATNDVMANVYEDIGELKLAIKHATISYQILDSLKMPDNKLRAMLVLSSVQFKLGNIAESKRFANQMLTLSKERKAKIFIKESYRLLSEIAKSEQQYQLALDYFKEYKNWNDSVFANEREKNIAALEFKANLAKKEMEVQLDLKSKENLNKKLSSNIFGLKIGILFSLIGLILVGTIVFFLYKSNKNKQRFNAELIQKNIVVEQQAKDKETLIQEVHHRVKNNLTMLQSLLYLQSKSSNQTEVKLVLAESQTRILSMALVHQHLYDNDREGTLNLVEFFNSLLNEISSTFLNRKHQEISFKAIGVCDDIGIKLAVPLGLIINEMITNSLKYAFTEIDHGEININVSQSNNQIIIKYSDNGPGLKKQFELENNGFGFKIINLLSRQINASIDYKTQGTQHHFLIGVILPKFE